MKVALRNLGGLGNQMHRYAHARALCEQRGYELHMEPSVLAQVFTLDGAVHPPITGKEDIVLEGYCQRQQDIIYTRRDCRRWFAIKPEMMPGLPECPVMFHLRRGDYHSAGYPTISLNSYRAAFEQHCPGHDGYSIASDDEPWGDPAFTGPLSFVPDFVRLMRAEVLFRANSTFSFWAHVLGHGRVFSPIITGLQGGIEHDGVKFTEGNHNACADLPGIVGDLRIPA